MLLGVQDAQLPHARQMLDICTAGPMWKHDVVSCPPSLCVAPCSVFPDYDRVIALLNSGQYESRGKEANDTRTAGECCPEQLQESDRMTEIRDIDRYLVRRNEIDLAKDACSSSASGDVENYCDNSGSGCPPCAATGTLNNSAECIRKPARCKPRMVKFHPYMHRPARTGTDVTASPVRCLYVGPDGTQCRKINKTPQEGARHWRSCHLYKEAKEMLIGVLPVGFGTAITSKAQLEEVKKIIQCPMCSALITRSDAMRRHLRTNCKAFGRI